MNKDVNMNQKITTAMQDAFDQLCWQAVCDSAPEDEQMVFVEGLIYGQRFQMKMVFVKNEFIQQDDEQPPVLIGEIKGSF